MPSGFHKGITKNRKVNSTACASKKNKTFHRKAFCAALQLLSHPFNLYGNETLHRSELGPHWVLGPKNSKFGPMGPKKFCSKISLHNVSKIPFCYLVGF